MKILWVECCRLSFLFGIILVAHEAERIDSRFLEPACGEGAFLAPILLRKLATCLLYTSIPGVRQVSSTSGFSCMGGNGENLGMGIAQLDPGDKRKTPELSLDSIMQLSLIHIWHG